MCETICSNHEALLPSHTVPTHHTHTHIYLIRTYFSISTSMTHSAKFSTYVPPSLSKVLCIGLVFTIEMLPASPRYCCSQPLPLRWLLAKWNLHNFLYEVNKSSQVQRQFSTCKNNVIIMLQGCSAHSLQHSMILYDADKISKSYWFCIFMHTSSVYCNTSS